MRLWLAFQCFFLILFARRLPAGAVALLPAQPDATNGPAPSLPPREAEIVATKRAAVEPVTVAAPDGLQAVQLLQILQREGRLLDFLQEDVDTYSDAQIGAAVRDIHRGCKKALAEHLPVEPVLRDAENAQVRVDVGFDPSRIRLVGNVVGEPPFVGALRHHGWRVGKVALPQPARGSDPSVVTPAEVELS